MRGAGAVATTFVSSGWAAEGMCATTAVVIVVAGESDFPSVPVLPDELRAAAVAVTASG